ncbi:hypothetical protein [Deinococcus yavapaiensis]|uniref:Uncharacterized protein n=1 Tax=Deinococcus yavapaiensis KR-236 TaxID=694435 RepID=A0A318SHU4_9DEIO|nr:hypothetical protein [Deinococcus yavapaiensis]PYE50942.1 hypothetical protein DES52_1168 [Deinococcus yavapaiensis KR-236]
MRATDNARLSYPNDPNAPVKFVKTFAFSSRSVTAAERSMLDNTSLGFTVPWGSRQYGHDATPQEVYVLEVRDRPSPNTYARGGCDVCMSVFAIR